MKRFYKDAMTIADGEGWRIELDGRPVRTPSRALLMLPTHALADAVAAEWAGQDDEIDPRTMPITGFANAAIDQIAPDPTAFATGVARYAETDLLCYRAEAPQGLVDRQAAMWDPLLDWAGKRYDAVFRTTQGVLHIDQPAETEQRLHAAVFACDPFTLAPLSTIVTLTGSLVCGLAIIEIAATPGAIWDAAEVDERWQAERWGEDAEAAARTAKRRADFDTACAFIALARPAA